MIKTSEAIRKFLFKNLLPNTAPQTKAEMYRALSIMASAVAHMEKQLEELPAVVEAMREAKQPLQDQRCHILSLKEELKQLQGDRQ